MTKLDKSDQAEASSVVEVQEITTGDEVPASRLVHLSWADVSLACSGLAGATKTSAQGPPGDVRRGSAT